ncbi:hypothetical protein M2338_002577 [Sphingobium sp. B2D3B]|nr:hypothetical protein [Sphingobium sp. B2D3B]MCW2400012.1 hypothetical protein [Sphingobium sp. B2D3C]
MCVILPFPDSPVIKAQNRTAEKFLHAFKRCGNQNARLAFPSGV